MSLALRLESFTRGEIAAPPPEAIYHEGDLAAARAAGLAEGRAAARAEAAGALARAVSGLADALAEDDARRRALVAAWTPELVALMEAVVATLAPPLRAEVLAGCVARLLADEIRDARPTPPVIGCEPAAVPALRAALNAAGLQRVEITEIPTGARFESAGGLTQIDPARVQRGLEQIIADMKESLA